LAYNSLPNLISLIQDFILNKLTFFIFLKLSINNYYKYVLYNYIIQLKQTIKRYISLIHPEIKVKPSYIKIKGQYLQINKYYFKVNLKEKKPEIIDTIKCNKANNLREVSTLLENNSQSFLNLINPLKEIKLKVLNKMNKKQYLF
jgi:hypothetical protein